MSGLISNLSQFLSETDIHGIKHVINNQLALYRRGLWFLVCLIATCYLLYLITTRFQRVRANLTTSDFNTYTSDFDPPRLLVCRSGCNAMEKPSNSSRLTLPEIILFLQYLYNVSDILEEVAINGKSMVRAKPCNGSCAFIPPKAKYPLHCEPKETGQLFYDLTASLQRKLKEENAAFDYDEHLKIFLRQNVQPLHFIKTCLIEISGEKIDCSDNKESDVFVIDDLNLVIACVWPIVKKQFTFESQSRQPFSNDIRLELDKSSLHYGTAIALANCDDFPSREFHGMFQVQYLREKSLVFTIQRRQVVRHIHPRDGGSKECTLGMSRSMCAQHCYVRRTNYTNFLNDAWFRLPEPRPFVASFNYTLMERCYKSCPRSCRETSLTVITDREESTSSIVTITLQAPQLVSMDEIEELLFYTGMDFLGEVGGYLGLFMDASLLTLYQILDFTVFSIGSYFNMRCCRGRRRVKVIHI